MRILFHSPILRDYPVTQKSWFSLRKEDIEIDYFLNRDKTFLGDVKYLNVAFKMNQAREIVLRRGYDYLFNVEHDIVLPHMALTKLKLVNAEVVSGLYRLRPGAVGHNNFAFRIPDPLGPQDADDRWIELDKDFHYGEVIHCSHISFGCILISREVLKKIRFNKDIDVSFSHKCRELNIPLLVHTGVRCGHIEANNTIIYA